MNTSTRAFRGAIVAALLASSTSARNIFQSPRMHDLHFASMLGIDAETALLNVHEFRQHIDNAKVASVPTEWTTLPINHDDFSAGTYQNRFWVNTDHYQSGGPVFVYDVGETSALTWAEFLLGSTNNFFLPIVQEFNGVGIVWEHRYYGESMPFNVSLNTPASDFAYLNNRQALADIPYFARNFSRSDISDDLTPDATPWVMIGGSYSGMRAAFSRNTYPDTFYAAYSSSAPVEARLNMSVYFDQVYRGMVAYGYEGCAKDIQAANSYIDEQLSQDDAAATTIKRMFLGDGGEHNSNGDFTYSLTSIYGTYQNFGMDAGDVGLSALCTYLGQNGTKSTSSTTDRHISNTGLAPLLGNKAMAERMASWPQMIVLINKLIGSNCSGPSSHSSGLSRRGEETQSASACDLSIRESDPDSISWTWQYCSQWGYFQSCNTGPDSLLSKYQTLDYQQMYCYRQFPGAFEANQLPAQPQADEVNKETGGWSIRPSNVYFSAGEFDPWRTLSVLSTEAFAPQNVTFSTTIPQCGVSTAENEVFGYIMPNAEHCFDTYLNFTPGVTSRGYFTSALKEWLICFNSTSS